MIKEFQTFWASFRRQISLILSFKEGTDYVETKESIRRDISFLGHQAWVLICSIMIASIGLNVNATAVIIGAMLISPLMGPIIGLGFSIGTNDLDMLQKSLKNLGIAVAISLITSTFYFFISPLDVDQPELLARTKPTILDVLIALFGGFAGIIVGCRKEKTNVVPGVAIATALMPPLCTAGYALANFKWSYFLGASYLFFINCVFITLSTIIVVRYLKFPLVEFVSKERLKRYQQILIPVLLLAIIPSSIIFVNVIQEARFTINAENFVNRHTSFQGSELLTHKVIYDKDTSFIDLYYIGEPITKLQQDVMQDRLSDYGLLGGRLLPATKHTQIRVRQEADRPLDVEATVAQLNQTIKVGILEDLYKRNESIIQTKDARIKLLENQVISLSKQDTIPYVQIAKEMGLHHQYVADFAFAQLIHVTVKGKSHSKDTIPTFLVKFDDAPSETVKKDRLNNIKEWLSVRLANDQIDVVSQD